ncbi:conserved hypothetical protein [Hyella patelloides LEGE 07179]|uniref:DUF4230 domain-containing protein n=1 Tax=Hyella patelloides LEGE 07179 TaxID=945734 RepID=A0A563VLS0_9CYAN|nr:DUF4230 domain-containing protein [Hyella patelloides]VEP12394.1 conserved hypothetical protein [Hyella patelloides LEGE 07179]
MTLAKSSLSVIKKILFLGTGGGLIAILAVFLTIQKTSDRFLLALENILQPQPTKLQVEDSALLLKQIQSMQELTTATYKMETIIPTSAERTLGENWTVATTKLLYLARGEVKAGIDLSEITIEDVEVSENKIAIAIPPAEILDSKIDVNNSQVYHYDRGFLNLGPDVAPQLQTLAQQKTLNKIVTTACNEGILDTANEKAQEAIAQFLAVTNEREIEINLNTELSSSCQ